MTLSIGIALGPEHAANPRELVACAELAMMTAKARGKSRIVVFHEDESERPDAPIAEPRRRPLDRAPEDAARRLEQAHPPARRVDEIGATIADELRQLIDYHNCRVFLRDGDELTADCVPRRADAGRGVDPRGARRRRSASGSRVTSRRPASPSSRATPQTAESASTSRARPRSRSRCSPCRCSTGRARVGVLVHLQARPRPVRRRRPPPARGPCRARLGRPRQRASSTKRSDARRKARRRCSSSPASSRPAPSSTRSLERIARGAARILDVSPRLGLAPGRRRWRARVPQRLVRGRATRVTRCPATGCRHRGAEAFSLRSEPFVSRARTTSTSSGASFDGRSRRRVCGCPDHARHRAGRAIAIALERGRRSRRTAARAARRDRRPGEAGAHERSLLREPRANVPLDRRGARQRARGEGRVHVLPCPLDHGTWP